jgi:hypothetical protein
MYKWRCWSCMMSRERIGGGGGGGGGAWVGVAFENQGDEGTSVSLPASGPVRNLSVCGEAMSPILLLSLHHESIPHLHSQAANAAVLEMQLTHRILYREPGRALDGSDGWQRRGKRIRLVLTNSNSIAWRHCRGSRIEESSGSCCRQDRGFRKVTGAALRF